MSHRNGFTLVELLIVIVVISILTAIALPNYTAYVARGKIQEATTNLLAMRTKLEQFYQDKRTYAGACAAGTVAPLPTGLKYFSIDCPTLTATQYTIRATGVADLANLVLTINEANARTTVSVPAGWTMPSSTCWISKKTGEC